jgi:methylmalonyl-CoA mutase
MENDLLQAFTAPSYDAWRAQIQRELKSQELVGFEFEPDVVGKPYLYPDPARRAVPLWSEPIDWAICADIDCSSVQGAAVQISEALNGGCTALRLCDIQSFDQLAVILEPVYLQMIVLRIHGELGRNKLVFDALRGILTAKGIGFEDVQVYLENDFTRIDSFASRALFLKEAAKYPSVKSVHISGDLPQLTVRTNNFLSHHDSIYHPSLHFTITIGKQYLGEIARLRAWYHIWFNLQKKHHLPVLLPSMHVDFEPMAYTLELNTNLIRATTMAMSGVIGGCTSLTVTPFDAPDPESNTHGVAFAHRIARNVQHLLKLESGMHKVIDPSAGSYYIEDLTQQYAAKAWQSCFG